MGRSSGLAAFFAPIERRKSGAEKEKAFPCYIDNGARGTFAERKEGTDRSLSLSRKERGGIGGGRFRRTWWHPPQKVVMGGLSKTSRARSLKKDLACPSWQMFFKKL